MYKGLILSLSWLLTFSVSANSSSFTPALFKENTNKKYPTSSTYSRMEQWFKLSYIIGANGTPKDIVIIDSNDNRESIKNDTVKYLKNISYQPATINGQAIDSAHVLLFRRDISFTSNPNDNVSSSFYKRYNKINDLIIKDQLTKVPELLIELREKNAKNMREQALLAWVSAFYYFKNKDQVNYAKQIEQAYLLRENMATKIAYKATMSWFEQSLRNKDYYEAIKVLRSLSNIKGLKLEKSSYEQSFNTVIELAKQQEQQTYKKSISEFGNLYHQLSRSNLNIEMQAVKSVELRCLNGIEQIPVSNQITYQLPDQYRSCALLFLGSPNTKINITESGALNL